MKAHPDLLKVLDREQEVLGNLVALEIEKNAILVSQDLTKLSVVTERENLYSEMLSGLEEERIAVLARTGLPANLAGVIESLPEGARDAVASYQASLVDLLNKLRFYNQLNGRILQESIKFFRYSISLFTEETGGNRTYGAKGHAEPAGPARQSIVLNTQI